LADNISEQILSGISYHCKARIRIAADIQKEGYFTGKLNLVFTSA